MRTNTPPISVARTTPTRLLRYVAAGVAGLTALMYLLIGLGLLPVGVAASEGAPP